MDKKDCEECKKTYDEDEEGVNTYNAYTGEEHNFCSDICHIKWAKKQ